MPQTKRSNPRPLKEILSNNPRRVSPSPVLLSTQTWEAKPIAVILGNPESQDLRLFDSEPTLDAQEFQEEYAEPAKPDSCTKKYPPGSKEARICEGFGDWGWANCVRGCLYEVVPDEWKDQVDMWDLDYLIWAAKHLDCWTECLGEIL